MTEPRTLDPMFAALLAEDVDRELCADIVAFVPDQMTAGAGTLPTVTVVSRRRDTMIPGFPYTLHTWAQGRGLFSGRYDLTFARALDLFAARLDLAREDVAREDVAREDVAREMTPPDHGNPYADPAAYCARFCSCPQYSAGECGTAPHCNGPTHGYTCPIVEHNAAQSMAR